MDAHLQIIGILVLAIMPCSAVAIRDMKMVQNSNYQDLILLEGNNGDIKTRSKLECAKRCAITYGCVSMFYHSKTNQCVLQDFLGSYVELHKSKTTLSNGWKYYDALLMEVAYGKKCNQSSIYMEEYPTALPYFALDRKIYTSFHTAEEYNPKWWVDLGELFDIKRIEITNRVTSGFRLGSLNIDVGKSLERITLCAYYQGPAGNGEHLTFDCAITGRFVNLSINKTLDPGDICTLLK